MAGSSRDQRYCADILAHGHITGKTPTGGASERRIQESMKHRSDSRQAGNRQQSTGLLHSDGFDSLPLPKNKGTLVGASRRRIRSSIAAPQWRSVRKPPVFELVAATAHRAVAFRWVRLPSVPKRKGVPQAPLFFLEQDTGVEPAFTAWEAVVLPIYESCVCGCIIAKGKGKSKHLLSSKYPPPGGGVCALP